MPAIHNMLQGVKVFENMGIDILNYILIEDIYIYILES